MNKEEFDTLNVFGRGEENSAFAQFFIGKSYLNPLTSAGEGKLFFVNVTFEPACRNNWHIHHASVGGGQILLCVAGEGWYQEWGKPARSLKAGDVVEIPAGSALAQKESVTARDLIGCKVFASKRALAQGIVGWFGDVYDKLDIYVTYNLIYNVAMLVDCGMGAAMCIDGAVSLYRNPNIVFRPFSPELTVVSALAWKKSQPASCAVKKFIEHLKQSADPASGEL